MKKSLIGLLLLTGDLLQAQADSTATMNDSIIVRKTSFVGISGSIIRPPAVYLYERDLMPVEGITQTTDKILNAMWRTGINTCTPLWRNFSINSEFGLMVLNYKTWYGIAQSVTPATSTMPAQINSSIGWTEEKNYITAYADINPVYRFFRNDRFDIAFGPGVALTAPFRGKRSPAAMYYLGLTPRVRVGKATWFQFRVDYGWASRDYSMFRKYLMYQAGLAYRFDRRVKEPRKKAYYIRVYED